MVSLVTRYGSIATLGLALLSGANCGPSPGATFAPTTGVLSVTGTANGDVIVVRVAANGSIVVNNGQMPIQGGVPTVANTHRIDLRGADGADFLELDESGGPLPAVRLFGGAGKDVLVGGSGNDEIDGGAGDDVALMGDGDDTYLWKSGGGVDTVEGEAGNDTLRFEGDDAAANVTISAAAGRVAFFQDVRQRDHRPRWRRDDPVPRARRCGHHRRRRHDRHGADTGRRRSVGEHGRRRWPGRHDHDDGHERCRRDRDHRRIRWDLRLRPSDERPHPRPGTGPDALDGQRPGRRRRLDASGPGAGAIRLSSTEAPASTRSSAATATTCRTAARATTRADGRRRRHLRLEPRRRARHARRRGGRRRADLQRRHVNETFDISAVGDQFVPRTSPPSRWTSAPSRRSTCSRGGQRLILVGDLSGTGLLELNLDLAAAGGGGDLQPDGVLVNGTTETTPCRSSAMRARSRWSVPGIRVHREPRERPRFALRRDAGRRRRDLRHGPDDPLIVLTEDGGDDDDVLIGGDGGDVLFGGNGDDVLRAGPASTCSTEARATTS